MAEDPDYGKETVFQKVQPGWVLGECGKYIPGEAGNVEAETVLKYEVTPTTGNILQALRQSGNDLCWVNDLGSLRSTHVIRLLATKICEVRAVDSEFASDIGAIVESALYGSGKPCVPADMKTYFSCAHLYPDLKKRCMMTSLKESLEDFCSFLRDCTVRERICEVTVMRCPTEKNKTHEMNTAKMDAKNKDDHAEPIQQVSSSCLQAKDERFSSSSSTCKDQHLILHKTPRSNLTSANYTGEPTYKSVLTLNLAGKVSDCMSQDDSHKLSESLQHVHKASDEIRKIYLQGLAKDNKINTARSKELGIYKEVKNAVVDTAVFGSNSNAARINPVLEKNEKSGNSNHNDRHITYASQPEQKLSVADTILEDCKNGLNEGLDQTTSGTKSEKWHTNFPDIKGNEIPLKKKERENSQVNSNNGDEIKDVDSKEISGSIKTVGEINSELEYDHVNLRKSNASKLIDDSDLYSGKCAEEGDNCSSKTQSKSAVVKSPVRDYEHHHAVPRSVETTTSRSKRKTCLKPVDCVELSGLTRKYFGVKSTAKGEKVIVLIGAKGSGKTTLLNFAANILKGVKVLHDEIFVIAKDFSNPCWNSVIAYTFCFAENETPITIIDTPGLSEDMGAENSHLQVIKTFLTNQDLDIQLHAIGYVSPAHATHFTSSERVMIDFLVTHFGQGISANFVTLITHADFQQTPQVIENLRSYGVKSNVFFMFNNTAFNMRENEIDDMDRIYWRKSSRSLKKCVKFLNDLPPLAINSFKAKQNEAYSASVTNSADMKLRSELKNFMLLFQDKSCLTKELQEKSEQVWGLTMVLHRLKSTSGCSFSDVESVLTAYVVEVASEISFPSKDCIMLLSLCPSRGLLEAGKSVIKCMYPLYDKAAMDEPRDNSVCEMPNTLFCEKCKKNHQIKRQKPNVSKKSSNSGDEKAVTYSCQVCNCDESDHVSRRWQKKSSNFFSLTKRAIILHTKNVVGSILPKYSVPGYEMNSVRYLELISSVVDDCCKHFIEDILKC